MRVEKKGQQKTQFLRILETSERKHAVIYADDIFPFDLRTLRRTMRLGKRRKISVNEEAKTRTYAQQINRRKLNTRAATKYVCACEIEAESERMSG